MTSCHICNGTGLIPFVKNGKAIPNVNLFCECREDIEDYRPPNPEDFDFPMSYSVYRSLCQQHGWQDPGPDRPQEPSETKPQVVEHIVRHSNLGAKEFDLLQQTALKTQYLEEKLTEHLEFKKKPRGKY